MRSLKKGIGVLLWLVLSACANPNSNFVPGPPLIDGVDARQGKTVYIYTSNVEGVTEDVFRCVEVESDDKYGSSLIGCEKVESSRAGE